MVDTMKLDKWADLLLDTGKRNNLINFKDAKASTVEVLLVRFIFFVKVDTLYMDIYICDLEPAEFLYFALHIFLYIPGYRRYLNPISYYYIKIDHCFFIALIYSHTL